jgi:hypothetical protein
MRPPACLLGRRAAQPKRGPAAHRRYARSRQSAAVPVAVGVPHHAAPGDYLSGVSIEALGQNVQSARSGGVAIANVDRYVIGVDVQVPTWVLRRCLGGLPSSQRQPLARSDKGSHLERPSIQGPDPPSIEQQARPEPLRPRPPASHVGEPPEPSRTSEQRPRGFASSAALAPSRRIQARPASPPPRSDRTRYRHDLVPAQAGPSARRDPFQPGALAPPRWSASSYGLHRHPRAGRPRGACPRPRAHHSLSS